MDEYGREYSEKHVGSNAKPPALSTTADSLSQSSLEIVTHIAQKSASKQDLVPGCSDFEWCSEDFLHIAAVQNANENAQARLCNRILVCDTDSFATSIWHERYMSSVDGRVMQIFDELRAQSDFSKRHYFLMDSVGISMSVWR